MAVAYKAKCSAAYNGSSSGLSMNISGCSVGDLCFIWISRNAAVAPISGTLFDSWTQLQHPDATYGSWLYYKVLTQGDLDATYATLNWSASTKMMGHWVTYTGHDATTPIGTSNSWSSSSAGNTITFGSITSNEPMLVGFAATYSANSTRSLTEPSGYTGGTPGIDYWHTTSDFMQAICDTGGAWGGGTSNPTPSIGSNTTYRQGAHVAIKTASAAAATGFMTANSKFWG